MRSERRQRADFLPQAYSVARRMSAAVVVEVREHVQAVGGTRGQPFGPLVEPVVGIPAAVSCRAEVKADIDERSHNELAGHGPLHVVKAERDVVTAQQLVHSIVVPAWFAEFDRVSMAARQRAEEDLEALEIQGPAWRQLIENGAQARAELPRVV